jgi:hypothetical protein
MRDHISHTTFETSEQDDTLDGALQPATPRARAQRSPTVIFGEPQPSRAAMEEDVGGARGACALLTPKVSRRGAEDGAMGGRVAAGLERGLPDDGLRGSRSSVLNTSHHEVSSHHGDNTLLQLTLSAVRGAAGALYAAVSPIAWSVIGWALLLAEFSALQTPTPGSRIRPTHPAPHFQITARSASQNTNGCPRIAPVHCLFVLIACSSSDLDYPVRVVSAHSSSSYVCPPVILFGRHPHIDGFASVYSTRASDSQKSDHTGIFKKQIKIFKLFPPPKKKYGL